MRIEKQSEKFKLTNMEIKNKSKNLLISKIVIVK